MKKIIKKLGSKLIFKSGLSKLVSFDTKILAFHTVNPNCFEQQIKHLVKYYKIIPLSEIFSKNKKSIILTFDDGYKNNLEYAYPILKKYKVPATLFIACDFIDKNLFAWWDRLEHSRKKINLKFLKNNSPEEIEKNIVELTGFKINAKKPSEYDFMNWKDVKKITDVFEIGSHTLTHPILTNIPLREAEKEILESKKKIEKKLGKQIVSFAYPNGDHNDSLIGLVAKSGYDYAVIYDKGKNTSANRFNLHRRGINVNDDLPIFATKVAGVF